MKFVTVEVLGIVDSSTGREIMVGGVNKYKRSFIAVDHIVLINIKEDKVYLTISTGEVLISSLSILSGIKSLLT